MGSCVRKNNYEEKENVSVCTKGQGRACCKGPPHPTPWQGPISVPHHLFWGKAAVHQGAGKARTGGGRRLQPEHPSWDGIPSHLPAPQTFLRPGFEALTAPSYRQMNFHWWRGKSRDVAVKDLTLSPNSEG